MGEDNLLDNPLVLSQDINKEIQQILRKEIVHYANSFFSKDIEIGKKYNIDKQY
jgi:predicted SprT family Zn-dependent metalloprotease